MRNQNNEVFSLFTMIGVFLLVALQVFETIRNENMRLEAESEAKKASKIINEQMKLLKGP